jgi:transcriptional regulator with XRE-family HTH domain
VDNLEVGRRLRALRAASGRTVASVAMDAGLSVPYVANLENGRGNPTTGALSRLASALGMRLTISLDPAGAGAEDAQRGVAEIPQSLVRLGRTARFQAATELMAANLGLEPSEFTRQLVSTLALIEPALARDLTEPDWWRLIDALMLIVIYPATAG